MGLLEVICCECGRRSFGSAAGWEGHLVDLDDDPQLHLSPTSDPAAADAVFRSAASWAESWVRNVLDPHPTEQQLTRLADRGPEPDVVPRTARWRAANHVNCCS